jgi:hypothetical protein
MNRLENDVSNNSFIFAGVFVAVVTFLVVRCVEKIEGLTHRQRD